MRLALAFTVLALAAACGGEAGPDPCDDGPSYTNQVAPIVAEKCVTCHSRDLAGSARSGAPDGLDFDDFPTLQPVVASVADAITSGRMPPVGVGGAVATTAEERRIVDRWRSCGYPQ